MSLPGRPRSQGGGGGRVQAARQEPQGQGNGPEGERDPEQYRSPGPGRQCPCGCPRQVAQLKPPARGPIRLPPGGSPPLCPTVVTRVHYLVTGGHRSGACYRAGPRRRHSSVLTTPRPAPPPRGPRAPQVPCDDGWAFLEADHPRHLPFVRRGVDPPEGGEGTVRQCPPRHAAPRGPGQRRTPTWCEIVSALAAVAGVLIRLFEILGA